MLVGQKPFGVVNVDELFYANEQRWIRNTTLKHLLFHVTLFRFRLVTQRTPRMLQGEMSKKVYFSIEQN